MSWYSGQTLSEVLHNIKPGEAEVADFRFDVQQVLHVQNKEFTDYRAYAGRVVSGSVSVGDEVTVMPSGIKSEVVELRRFTNTQQEAKTGESIQLRLKDDVDVSRGMILVKNEEDSLLSKEINAKLVWLDEKQSVPGGRYLLQSGTRVVQCKLQQIEAIIPPENPE